MATVLLSTLGAGLGSAIGGNVLGLSMAAIGRYAGAAIGQGIDQRMTSAGADPIHVGRVERVRVTGAGEGTPVPYVVGRVRTAGHIIWASQFSETIDVTGGTPGSKGMPPQPEVRSYRYSVNLAIALCQGEITAVSRLWADGVEIGLNDINMRIHRGTETQDPDPTIEAIEGVGQTPAYRGLAYVVFENLQLAQFGNRIPQFSFEVCRTPTQAPDAQEALSKAIRAVSVIPATGEYALATRSVTLDAGLGRTSWSNRNTPSGISDFSTSLNAMTQELPNCDAASLVVSWFGDDLRCGHCQIQPKVEQNTNDPSDMPWRAGGISRAQAALVPRQNGEVVYGGTPADRAVIEAIQAMTKARKKVMFYPFVLMDQIEGNGRPDPYSDAGNQPPLPWRGRITLDHAAGRPKSRDGTAAAADQVAAFFGAAQPSDFGSFFNRISYSGPDDWGYRRFILHYAHLCAKAGGVDSFCIGSEMRGLTQIRGADHSFPAVEQMIALARDVRTILGPDTKIGYAADWSEYFGYSSPDGNRYFHLDPLWADRDIDFVGIDNYMPLADWRDGPDHADAAWDTPYNTAYLQSNIEGGEGFDWYYASDKDRDLQNRSPITDGAHQEHWIWRYKDIRSWWSQPHHNRIDGLRDATPTDWVPQSKPIWFTELGCAAINKGANQPNRFVDPKSSESGLPHYSNGLRDDMMQHAFLTASLQYWSAEANNPMSDKYHGPMIDPDRIYIWAWDARPYPWFPNAKSLWSDGGNYQTGHWLNGRSTHASLARVVAEICEMAGVRHYDTSRLFGVVRGYHLGSALSGRAMLQGLSQRFAFDAVERDGTLVFLPRQGGKVHVLSSDHVVAETQSDHPIERRRAAAAEISGRVQILFEQADADFTPISEEVSVPNTDHSVVSSHELPMVMTRSEARETLEQWLAAARAGRDTLRFALPPSARHIGVGDKITFADLGPDTYRVDQAEQGPYQRITAIRMDDTNFVAAPPIVEHVDFAAHVPSLPVAGYLIDCPNLRDSDSDTAPYVAVTADPWSGPVSVYGADGDQDFDQELLISHRSVVGRTLDPIVAKTSAYTDKGIGFRVEIGAGALRSVSDAALASGHNLAVLGNPDTQVWEIIQFRSAELIGPSQYRLRDICWGLRGTDAERPNIWAPGTVFIVLGKDRLQVPISLQQCNSARVYRIGPADRPLDDAAYREHSFTATAKGVRPLSPVHLRFSRDAQGVTLRWVRRGRIDADEWFETDIPLGEERENYVVTLWKNDTKLQSFIVDGPQCVFDHDILVSHNFDAGPQAFRAEVAQVSTRVGAGLSARIALG